MSAIQWRIPLIDATLWTDVKKNLLWIILASCVGISPSLAPAFEVNEAVTLDAAVRTFVQYGHFSNAFDMNGGKLGDKTRGALIVDLAGNFGCGFHAGHFSPIQI